MKKIMFMFGLMPTVTACASGPVPTRIRKKFNVFPVDQLESDFKMEREPCGTQRGEEKTPCSEKVRQDYTVHKMIREKGSAQ